MPTQPDLPENGKIVPVGKTPRAPEVESMAARGHELRTADARWVDVCNELGIVKTDGSPDPGLAKKIVDQGYDPRRPETRRRLGLPPICVACGQKVRRVRHIPAWLKQAVDGLAALEVNTQPPPDPVRVYARGGKRIPIKSDPSIKRVCECVSECVCARASALNSTRLEAE